MEEGEKYPEKGPNDEQELEMPDLDLYTKTPKFQFQVRLELLSIADGRCHS